MTNKELITQLLEFPMEIEICVDMHQKYPLNKPVAVGWDDDHKRVWITNYK